MLSHDVSGVEIVAELGRRFAAGDGAGAAALFPPQIRIEQPASLPHGGWHADPTGQTWTAKATGRSATVDVVELFSFRDGATGSIRT